MTEFTARDPLHHGDFVDRPHDAGGHTGHWSRWEKSATTFGPAGRLTATVLFLVTLPLAFSFGMFLYALFFPLVAFVVLSGIWARGWVVPGELEGPPVPDRPRPGAYPEPPATPAMIGWRVAGWVGVIAAGIVFSYGPMPAKAAVLGLGAIIGLYAFARGFFVR